MHSSAAAASNPTEEACKSENFHAVPRTPAPRTSATSAAPRPPAAPSHRPRDRDRDDDDDDDDDADADADADAQGDEEEEEEETSNHPPTPLSHRTDRIRFCRPTIVWYRGHDLRTDDHPALLAAAQRGGPVVPLFIWDPDTEDAAAFGMAKTWWLRKSLACLDTSLTSLGAPLRTRKGNRTEQLLHTLRATGADAVFWNRCYEPHVIGHDEKLRSSLRRHGYLAESFKAELLVEPWELTASDVAPRFDTFNSYMRAWMRLPPPSDPTPSPSRLKPLKNDTFHSAGIQNIGLCTEPDADDILSKHWSPGSRFAEKQLTRFLNELFPKFCESRHRRHMNGSSRLSPHLRFGEISPRRIYAITKRYVSLWKRDGMIPSSPEKDLDYFPTAAAYANHCINSNSNVKDGGDGTTVGEARETSNVIGGLMNVKSAVRREGSIQMEVHPGAVVHDNANELHCTELTHKYMKQNHNGNNNNNAVNANGMPGGHAVDRETSGAVMTSTTTTRLNRNKFSKATKPRIALSARMFLKNLCLRDFSYHVLYFFPNFNSEPLLPEFASFPWSSDQDSFNRWRQGMTGYPFLDAAMRQLISTGWVHNNMRFLLATFLTKHLLQPWAKGLKEFYSLLVDGDYSSNALGWQWTAGSNTDSFPLRLLVNPVRIGALQDPTGAFIRKWIPELRQLPNELIHEPWKASSETLRTAGISMGKVYPHRIVLMSAAKKRMQSSIWHMKKIFSNSGIPRLILFDRDRSDVKEVPDEQVELLNLDDPAPISTKHNLLPSLWSLVQCDSSAAYMCERSPSPEPLISLDSANLDDSALEISLETGSIEQAILSSDHDDDNVDEDGHPYRRPFGTPFQSNDRYRPRMPGRNFADPLGLSLLEPRGLDGDGMGEGDRKNMSNVGSNHVVGTEQNKYERNGNENFLDDTYRENASEHLGNAENQHLPHHDGRNVQPYMKTSSRQQQRRSSILATQPSSKRVRRLSPVPGLNDVSAAVRPPFHSAAPQDTALETVQPSYKPSSFPSQLPPNPAPSPYPLDPGAGHSGVANVANYNTVAQQPLSAVQGFDALHGSNVGMVSVPGATCGMSSTAVTNSMPSSLATHHDHQVASADGTNSVVSSAMGHANGAGPSAFAADSSSLYAQQLSMIQFYGVPPVMPMMGLPGSSTERPDVFGAPPAVPPATKFASTAPISNFVPMTYGLYGNGMLDGNVVPPPFGMGGTNPYTTSGMQNSSVDALGAEASAAITMRAQAGTDVPTAASTNGFSSAATSLLPQSAGFAHAPIAASPSLLGTSYPAPPPAPVPVQTPPHPSPCIASVPHATPHAPAHAHVPGHTHSHVAPSPIVTPAHPAAPAGLLPSAAANGGDVVGVSAALRSSATPVLVAAPATPAVSYPPPSKSNAVQPIAHEQLQQQQQSQEMFAPSSVNAMYESSVVGAVTQQGTSAAAFTKCHNASKKNVGASVAENAPQKAASSEQPFEFDCIQDAGSALNHQRGVTTPDAARNYEPLSSKQYTAAPPARATAVGEGPISAARSDSREPNSTPLIPTEFAPTRETRQNKHGVNSDRQSGNVMHNEVIGYETQRTTERRVTEAVLTNGYAAAHNDNDFVSDSSSPLSRDADASPQPVSGSGEQSKANDEHDSGGPRAPQTKRSRDGHKKTGVSKRPRNRKQIEVNGSMIRKSSKTSAAREESGRSRPPDGDGKSAGGRLNGTSKQDASGTAPSKGKGRSKVKLKGGGGGANGALCREGSGSTAAASASAAASSADDVDLGEDPKCLKDREDRLSAILALPGHEYHGFARYIRDKYVLTEKTDRENSKDYIRLCNLKDDYHRLCEDAKTKLKIYRIKAFFSNILRLQVTGEWDRHNHGGVRGPYVYGIRLRPTTSASERQQS